MNNQIEKTILVKIFSLGLDTKKGINMSLNSIYQSIRKSSPSMPIYQIGSSIVFEENDHYLVMYSENRSGEVVHCLGDYGYPKVMKNK